MKLSRVNSYYVSDLRGDRVLIQTVLRDGVADRYVIYVNDERLAVFQWRSTVREFIMNSNLRPVLTC